jgi:hypothetical protein
MEVTYWLSLQPQCFSEFGNDLGRIIRFGIEWRHVAAKLTALSVLSIEEEIFYFSFHFFRYKLYERNRVVRKDRRTDLRFAADMVPTDWPLFIYLFICGLSEDAVHILNYSATNDKLCCSCA